MTIISTTRTATADEIAREMDRRGDVIEAIEKERDDAINDALAAEAESRILRATIATLSTVIGDLQPQAEALASRTAERGAYRDACKAAGICMTCVLGAPDAFGCTDCLNTGWDGGAPAGFVPAA